MSQAQIEPVHGDRAAAFGGWSWNAPRGGEHFRRCSYCGSIHPDDLAAEAEWEAEWADQKYGWPHKFYAAIANRDPGRLFIVGAQSAGPRATEPLQPETSSGGIRWMRADRVPAGVCVEGWVRDGDPPLWERYDLIGLGTRPHHHAKFYSTHLADPQISAETKALIERRGGIAFTFTAAQVGWGPAES